MRIALIIVDRTLPGFNDLVDAISRQFHAKVTTAFVDLPMTRSFDSRRKQYDAGALLPDLAKFAPFEAHKAVFVIREDMFAGKLNFVFGLALGDACIVSTARLDPRFHGESDMGKARALFKERLVKEALHELGHTLGLPHCDKHCVMSFSNSIEEVDAKPDSFCEGCSKVLKTQSGQ